jgi:hypothetical protein
MDRITNDIKFSAPEPDISTSNIIVLKFADSKIPTFSEARNKEYIKYGEDNLYPEYLNYLYNKSAKHNAIITGKSNYVFGKGYENGDIIINRSNESLNDLSKKSITDIEIYGGYRLEIIWNKNKKVASIYHTDYTTLRKAKDGGFWFKQSWKDTREKEIYIPAFDPHNPVGNQIFEYNEYRPGIRFYPLPGYIGCNNYIETDIEISKYYLSAIRNGMMPSKLIQFYQGEPTDEKKKEIERRFSQKFAGAENAGRFIMVFNSGKDKEVDISDLSASELDKHFEGLNKTTQQEIYAGHLVTSPMLFGIKTEGQLGGNTELYTAYSIFQNTYAKPKAAAFDKEINWLLGFSNFQSIYELQPTDPIGVQFDVKDVVNSLPKQFVFENLGIPKEMWGLENIGSDNKPTPTIPVAPSKVVGAPGQPADTSMANENIRNLTAKQHQQVMRIIRQYSKGQLTELAAKALLRTGYGLNESDINDLLGIQPLAMSSDTDYIIDMFDSCGDNKEDFEILKSKKVSFISELEAEGDEEIYIQEAFKTYDVTATEDRIIELIKKDERITPEVIATTIGQTVAYVKAKIKSLTKRGYLEESTQQIGTDEIVLRNIPKNLDITAPPPTGKAPPTAIYIKYSYEGPQDSRNRPFCAKMMELNRLYSRSDIEKISERLGYSVFDRRGGFWMHHNGEITPYCRHHWKSNIVIKKGGKNVA